LLVDFLSAASRVTRISGIAGELLRFVGDLALLLFQFFRLFLSFSQPVFHRAVLALSQQPLRLLDLFLRLLSSLLLLRRVTALRLLLHILSGLLQSARRVGHLAVVVLARKLVQLARQPFGFFLQLLRGHLIAAARTGRPVNVKKGQFLAPWDVANIAEKLESAGCGNYVFTERGVTFGYNNLVADMRSLYWIRKQGYPVVFDATHSVQRPGSTGTSTGGDGELAPVLARSAMAAGCDGIFIETHPNPAEALSDGPNQIPLSDLPQLLSQLKKIHEVVR